ncbi:MAG: hypothetical protein KAH57_06195 [Thermoplasmata archaeon]|nr:hypothetical protein [Thermoplasmata archaeon]
MKSDTMFFPDPFLDDRAMEILDEAEEISDFRCSHCYMRIRGKVYRDGLKYFDGYCYSLRYILKYKENEIEANMDDRKI